MLRRQLIGEEEVHRTHVKMSVDSDFYMMTINEVIREQLDLAVSYRQTLRMANGELATYEVVGPIEARFTGKIAICNALV